MTFEYTSNFEDYKAAQDLYLHHRNSARVRWLIWKFGLPGFTAVCAIVAFLGRSAADKGFLPMMIWFTACGFVLTILVVVMRALESAANLPQVAQKRRSRTGAQDFLQLRRRRRPFNHRWAQRRTLLLERYRRLR